MILVDTTGIVAASAATITALDNGMFDCEGVLYPPDLQLLDLDPPHSGAWSYIDGAFVPIQLAEPNATPTIPDKVTMRQARLALHSFGLLDQIKSFIAAASPEAQIEWEYATDVERSNPLVALVQTNAGLSDQDIDNLFKLAATK